MWQKPAFNKDVIYGWFWMTFFTGYRGIWKQDTECVCLIAGGLSEKILAVSYTRGHGAVWVIDCIIGNKGQRLVARRKSCHDVEKCLALISESYPRLCSLRTVNFFYVSLIKLLHQSHLKVVQFAIDIESDTSFSVPSDEMRDQI